MNKKDIVIFLLICLVLFVSYGAGFFDGSNYQDSQLKECSKLEVEEGRLFALFSENFMLTINHDGEMRFGYYDSEENWVSGTYVGPEGYAEKFELLLDEMIEEGLWE